MTIQDNAVVELDYTLKDQTGKVLDSSEGKDPLVYLHGKKNIIPGLEKELTGKAVADSFSIVVPPTEAYGERNDQLISEIPRTELSTVPDLEVGMQLQAKTPNGTQVFTVTSLDEENAVLDGNHPLAGEELHFDITVKNVREASEEEMSHGHAHGPGTDH